VNFAVITLCVPSQRMFIVVSVYFVINSVRKLLDTFSYNYASIKQHAVKTYGENGYIASRILNLGTRWT
jgi:hypothetical protein